MRPKKIVVMGRQRDLEADAVIMKLRAMGQLPIRLNLDDMPDAASFSLRLENGGHQGQLRTPNRRIELDEIRSVFWQDQEGPVHEPDADGGMAFSRRELLHAVNGLCAVLTCHWMNTPDSARSTGWKAGRLSRAAELGFTIPRTLVSSDPEQVRLFCEQCNGRVVFKPISGPIVSRGLPESPAAASRSAKIIYTTCIDDAFLSSHFAEISATPCLFQEWIVPQCELRVAVVQDDIFAVELDPPSGSLLAPWLIRRVDPSLRPRIGSLPPEVAACCATWARRHNLRICSFHLILTPDGRHVFVDSTPDARGLIALEDRLAGLRIVDAIAAALLRGGDSN